MSTRPDGRPIDPARAAKRKALAFVLAATLFGGALILALLRVVARPAEAAAGEGRVLLWALAAGLSLAAVGMGVWAGRIALKVLRLPPGSFPPGVRMRFGMSPRAVGWTVLVCAALLILCAVALPVVLLRFFALLGGGA